MKRYLFILLFFFIAVTLSPAIAATNTECNIPVIQNLAGPEVIDYDHNGQVGTTYPFSVDVQGGTPPYTYTWRFGAGSENLVEGTGPKFASLSHVITDKWVVVSLRVKDSAGKSAVYENNGPRDIFTLGWESQESSSPGSSQGRMINVLDSSANPEGGQAYIHKVPSYPYKTPCSSGNEPSTGTTASTDESGIPWVPVIGIAAVAIAAIALANRMRKPKSGDKEKKDDGPVGYILQISPADTITISTEKPGSFTASAWKVDEKGTASPANNASITLVPSAVLPGLSIEPLSGMGSVDVTVSLDEPAGTDGITIQVNASAGGGGTSTTVRVNFEAETSIEFE